MPRKVIDLHFSAGVNRRSGLRASSMQRGEYPAPWAMNCRLEDALTNRLRGGSFTGIAAGSRPEVLYRDRMITFSGNAITASRQGRHADTEMRGDVADQQRPVLIQLAEAADTGGTVVAVVPHKDAYLLCFTADSTWVLSGDPATGTLRRVSDQVGIIGENAWCVAHDTVYFLSSHGLYAVGANGSDLKAVSEDKIPEDLTSVSDSDCTLTYNHADRGVYVHLTVDPDWFYDIARGQFWPFDTDTTDSHVLIGPVKLGGADSLGMIEEMHGIMAQGSASVVWRIVRGDTAEEAAANGKAAITAALAGSSYASYVRKSGAWAAGRSQTASPRVTAMYACLWLSSAGTWAYEGITLKLLSSGKWRK